MSAEIAIEQPRTDRAAKGRTRESHALPPGPRMPSVLQAVGWTWRPLSFMERCQRRYGDVFTLRIRHGGTWVLVCDPADVKRVFTAAPERLGVGEANTLLGPVLGPRSVMLLEEPAHMTRRRLMLPQFHGQRMESCAGMMGEVARRAVARWPVGQPFELWPQMQEITLESIMRVVFGPASDSTLRLHRLLRELTERMNAPRRLTLLALLGPRSMVGDPTFRAKMDQVEAAVLEEVRRRRAGELAEGEDVVSMLAHAHYEDGSPMTAQDLRDELVTLLLDGPTSTSLAWVFERLLRHPDKLARLREEVLASPAEDAYLDAVVKETLRLCPPVPIVVRKLLAPMRLGGHTVPAGAMVAPCVHLVHRREEVYPHPGRFEPERFLERPAGTYTWIPFGGGVRRCLAASFAVQEMKQVVRAVLQEVELRPTEAGSEHVSKSAISYSPGRRGLVLVTRRTGAGGRARAAVAA